MIKLIAVTNQNGIAKACWLSETLSRLTSYLNPPKFRHSVGRRTPTERSLKSHPCCPGESAPEVQNLLMTNAPTSV